MKSLFSVALALAFFISSQGFSVKPKLPGSGRPTDGKPGDVSGGRPAGTPAKTDGDSAAAHLGDGKDGSGSGTAARPRFAPLPQGDSKSAVAAEADKASVIEGGLSGLLKSQEKLSNGSTVKAEVDALIKELSSKLGLSTADATKLEEALALVIKQQELYKDKKDFKDYAGEVKSFLEELFGKGNKNDPEALKADEAQELLKSLKAQNIDPADFAANLIFAFRNVPEKLKTEIRELSALLKQGGDLAGPRIAARHLQVTAYAQAFKSALTENKPIAEAERLAMKAVLDLYRSKGLSDEEMQKLQCECLKTQFSCAK